MNSYQIIGKMTEYSQA